MQACKSARLLIMSPDKQSQRFMAYRIAHSLHKSNKIAKLNDAPYDARNIKSLKNK